MALSLIVTLPIALGLLISLSTCQQGPSSSPLKRDFPIQSITAPRSVLDFFTTKTNTIIRTKESRDFGARYLNESDQLTNEECTNWCWNYKTVDDSNPCNVAVFEQKDRHSCYLFDCGTPNQFKCKFTYHDSYSSSILNGTRQTYELSQLREQSKHESDLKGLAQSEPLGNGESLITKFTSDSHNNVPGTSGKHICQHFQFPCKNGTECIAIYNVCDGIAQCPDGSDESEDLKCPQIFVNDITKIEPTYKPLVAVSMKGSTEDVLTNPRMFEYPKAKAPDLDLSPDNVYNRKFSSGGFNRIPHSEYFNPPGAYLFPDPDYPRDLTPLFWPSVPGSPRQPPPPPLLSEMRDSVLSPAKINFEPLSQPLLSLSEDRGHKDWSLIPRDPPFPPHQLGSKLMKEGQAPSAPATDLDSRVKTESNHESSSVSSQFHSSALVSSPEAVAVTHLQDTGSSGRDTNSAVIALTLGICITIMLIVLVGCRMKSIHRKIARRGGRSLAHDADYLVNGMYL